MSESNLIKSETQFCDINLRTCLMSALQNVIVVSFF